MNDLLSLDDLMGFGNDSVRFDPHGYQEDAIGRKLMQSSLGLFWDMGLGKTGTVLEMFRRARRQMFPALLVAPLRCCTDVWPLEISKFGFDFRTSLIHAGDSSKGSAQRREAALRKKADIHLINPEGIPWLVEYLARHKTVPFRTLVVDESTKFKNPEAKRMKALASISSHIPHRLILTGTPIPKGYIDLWSQIYLLDDGVSLGRRFEIFVATYFGMDGWGNHYLLPGAKEEIDQKIAHLIHRGDANELLDMPELIENEISLTQPPEALKRVEAILQGFVSTDGSSGPSASSIFSAFDASMAMDGFDDGVFESEDPEGYEVLNAYAALRTVCSGFQYFPALGCKVKDRPEDFDPFFNPDLMAEERVVARIVDRIHERKLDLVDELIEGIGGKNLLIAFNFHEEREQLIRRFGCPVIDSRTTDRQASEFIRNWCAGSYPIMAIQPKSVGHGINLQSGGHHLLWYSLPNSLDDYLQTNARLYRQGQQSGTVFIHKFVSKGTVEERVSDALAKRELDQQSLLDALRDASGTVSAFR